MEDEVVSRLASFVLTKDEDEAIDFSADDVKISKQECQNSIMGKVKTYKGVNLGGLKLAMKIAWGYPNGFKVLEVGGGIYQFIFYNDTNLIRVLAGSLWHYNNKLIVLQRWVEGVQPSEFYFSESPFWIQL
ncbi:hypothetical protein Vadar_013098 [Vaccinium darrowii]|uniref:Uncharacterized protein n=1 Tax=Vaccinium darrowii TaxID=229202 RepID=A0ACB7ZAU7_9ERIC|nr:hypothetical protein Vadar_013098 [Vaccinium darrowii]